MIWAWSFRSTRAACIAVSCNHWNIRAVFDLALTALVIKLSSSFVLVYLINNKDETIPRTLWTPNRT